MPANPAAFLSYAHQDDDHDRRRLTQFCERLSGEVRMHTGDDFPIFQDRKDIQWGQNWRLRIEDALDHTTFFIPIITPSFFRSSHCRSELQQFLEHERLLKRNDLILPVYYVTHPALETNGDSATDELVSAVADRQYVDWRQLRFSSFHSPRVRRVLADLARRISDALERTPEEKARFGGVQVQTARATITIVIACHLEDFDSAREARLKQLLAAYLGIDPDDMKVVSKDRGSVRASLELPWDSAVKLLSAYRGRDQKLLTLLQSEGVEDIQGPRVTFEELYRALNKRIYRYLRSRVRNAADAEDLSQETWVEISRNLARFDPSTASQAAFAQHVAKLVLLRFYSKQQSRQDRESSVEDLPSSTLASERDERKIDASLALDDMMPAVFGGPSLPHQLLVFGYSTLLGWNPARIVEELGDVPLQVVTERFIDEYVAATGIDERRVELYFGYLKKAMVTHLREMVGRGPYIRYARAIPSHMLDRAIGETTFRDYLGVSVTHAQTLVLYWAASVQKRAISRAMGLLREAGESSSGKVDPPPKKDD